MPVDPKLLAEIAELDDARCVLLAEHVRASSGDPKARTSNRSAVGAVILTAKFETLARANDGPPGIVVDNWDRLHVIEHAERAAIYAAVNERKYLRGATMYCSRACCVDCARAMVALGFRRFVSFGGPEIDSQWHQSQLSARELLYSAGIEVSELPLDAARRRWGLHGIQTHGE